MLNALTIGCLVMGMGDAAGVASGTHGTQTLSTDATELVVTSYLVIEPVGTYGRRPLHRDSLEHAIVQGSWRTPEAGATFESWDGEAREWQAATADAEGELQSSALRGGYAFASITVERPGSYILEAGGHGTVYVNGTPRAGNPYAARWYRMPVRLEQGNNTLLFHCRRGGLYARLKRPASSIVVNTADATLPDLLSGDAGKTLLAAAPILNSSGDHLRNAVLVASIGDLESRTPLPPLDADRMRKAGFTFLLPDTLNEGPLSMALRVEDEHGRVLTRQQVELNVAKAGSPYRRTFRSDIDGSVQYFAVTPMTPDKTSDEAPALVLTLHGASVEAISQARAYAPKDWAYIVAPTNRRPFGFDWEDWGRLDALEVLDIAESDAIAGTRPKRTYLTGHSMGGHGTWHLGVTFPNRFAAIAPSAGWISFRSYGGAPSDGESQGTEELLRRASACSDTLALSDNLASTGIYVLHGDADDNVPVSEARTMRARLGEFHPDFAYYEQPGAGHWWGNQCVDWPPLFAFLKRHDMPDPSSVRDVRFVTMNPAVSPSCHWVTIEQQHAPLEKSGVDLSINSDTDTVNGTTSNVALLALDLDHAALRPLSGELTIQLDGGEWKADSRTATGGRLYLRREGSEWSVAEAPLSRVKRASRSGPFKQAFRHRMAFVYGTAGTSEESTWARNKAHLDAETFWYRGNGSVDVLSDRDFLAAPHPDRNIILYGNAEQNAAWSSVLGDCPIRVDRTSVSCGNRTITGADLACLFVYPRAGNDASLVGVVCGTGMAGSRLTERMPYFVSGVGFPDITVLDSSVLTDDNRGLRAAGFFNNTWQPDEATLAIE